MIQIRKIRAEDLPDIAALESENLSPWSISLLAEASKKTDEIIFVAQQKEEIVAWLDARVIPPEAELLKLAVRRRMRRQGVATKLFSCLCRELVAYGCRELFLEVRACNLPARTFYQANGCVQIGQRVVYYRNPDDDALVLKRTLTGGNNYSTERRRDENNS